MDNPKEIEQDSGNEAAANNDAMVIDNNIKKEETIGGEEGKGLCNDLGKENMEVENERPAEGNDERLVQVKEEGKKTVETEQNSVVDDSNKNFNDVANHSVAEQGSVETSPANERTHGENPKDQLVESVVTERVDEKPKQFSHGVAGTESSVEGDPKKEEMDKMLTPQQSLAKNGASKEELNNEVKSKKMKDHDNEVTGGQSTVYDATKGETSTQVEEKLLKPELDGGQEADMKTPSRSFLSDTDADGYESGTEEEQVAFIKELEVFHRERGLDFKPPKFYQEKLNLLKLWRSVIKLGGYEQVTSCKLWRQVGESFRPPKTCTTVSWTFRGFYEKSLLEYEKHKILSGELPEIDASVPGSISAGPQVGLSQGSGSGRTRRDAAARAMQGWHSMRLLSNGEVGDPIIKDKNSISLGKREKQLKSIGLLKRRKELPVEQAGKVAHLKSSKPQSETMIVDVGPPADWVKINVQRTKDCFEIYALVPGLLREEVRVQSDPAGRLVISGQPLQQDNPWGVTPFKKVVSLPSRIDPHQTSAVVTLQGQLFVRVPFEQSDT